MSLKHKQIHNNDLRKTDNEDDRYRKMKRVEDEWGKKAKLYVVSVQLYSAFAFSKMEIRLTENTL